MYIVNVIIVIFTGIITGLFISVVYFKYIYSSNTKNISNEEIQKDKYQKDKYVPNSWDKKSDLLKCRNCGVLNEKRYSVCRKCVTNLNNSELLTKNEVNEFLSES